MLTWLTLLQISYAQVAAEEQNPASDEGSSDSSSDSGADSAVSDAESDTEATGPQPAEGEAQEDDGEQSPSIGGGAAPNPDQRARDLYEEGREKYRLAKYDEAAKAFAESYELSGRSALLLNLAAAHERAGNTSDAIDTLKQYRVYVKDEAERERLGVRIYNLEEKLRAEELADTERLEEMKEEVYGPPPKERNWLVPGVAGGGALAFGTLAALSHSWGLQAQDEGDADRYATMRTVNNVSLGLAGVGVGLAVVSVAIGDNMALIPTGHGVALWTRF